MKLVTFGADRKMQALVVSFQVFVKDYQKSSLALFEIEQSPVPIPKKTELIAIQKSTKLYHKPTDNKQYVHFNSAHSWKHKKLYHMDY